MLFGARILWRNPGIGDDDGELGDGGGLGDGGEPGDVDSSLELGF